MNSTTRLPASPMPSGAKLAASDAPARRFSSKRLLYTLLGEHLIWVLLALLVLVGVWVPGFLSAGNMFSMLWATAPLACMVLGLFFVVLTGGLDLSLESTFGLASTLLVVYFVPWLPASSLLALVIVLALGAAFGLFNGLYSVGLGVNPFLVTLATLMLMRGISVNLIPEGVYDLPESVTWLGGGRLGGVPVAILVWFVVYLLAFVALGYHKFGKDVFALGNNEEAAFIAGVNVKRTKVLCFVIAGALAALGGLLEVGRRSSVDAEMGEGAILMVFAGVILGGTDLKGGIGRVGGIFGAVLMIALIENLLNMFSVPPPLRKIVFGCVMLVAIFLASLQGRLRLAARGASA